MQLWDFLFFLFFPPKMNVSKSSHLSNVHGFGMLELSWSLTKQWIGTMERCRPRGLPGHSNNSLVPAGSALVPNATPALGPTEQSGQGGLTSPQRASPSAHSKLGQRSHGDWQRHRRALTVLNNPLTNLLSHQLMNDDADLSFSTFLLVS